jgi:murein DD-endopeptidase MepM/ murein hydrolase activator NlpD
MDWHSFFQTFQNNRFFSKIKQRLYKMLSLSESPIGFVVIAAIGLISLGLFNLNHLIEPIEQTAQNNDIVSSTASAEIANSSQRDSLEAKIAGSTTIENQAVIKTQEEETLSLKRNETLIDLLVKRSKIERQNAHAAVNAIGKIADLRKIRPNQSIRIKKQTEAPQKLASLKLRTAFDQEATVSWQDGKFEAHEKTVDIIHVNHLVEGTIDDSLYLSAKQAGASDKIIIDLIRLMSFDVDFQRDIRKGDGFTIYYQRSYAPMFNDVREDEILSASLTLRSNKLEAISFTTDNGETSYYDTQGKSTQKALMKTPVEGARLSSRFGRRKHPILGYTRLHKGVDFAAPRGTPIMAAGSGTIEMATRNGSFGNYIRIRHGNSYKTAYAHLKSYARGIKKGKKVKQGQIIGYIGTTGRSTGPHLHYEVLLSGKQVNPQSLKLPTARTLKARNLQAFQTHLKTLSTEIEQVRIYATQQNQTNIALNISPNSDDSSTHDTQ